MSFHWHWYYTVHVYFCDSRWSFLVEANHSMFVYICIAVRDSVIKKTWISNIICRGLFCVQWVMVKGDFSICWYWKNCWPSLFRGHCSFCWYWWHYSTSLFKLSFHKQWSTKHHTKKTKSLSNTNSTKNRERTQVLRKGRQFLLH